MPQDQAATFAVLRQPKTAADALPAAMLAPGLVNGPAAATYGTNPALARRANGLADGAVWIIPGASGMCLAALSDAAAGASTDASSGASCGDSAIAQSGRMYVESHGPADASADFIAGLVPDGVDVVTIDLANGQSRRIAVHDNVYAASADSAIRSVELEADGSRIRLNP